MQAVGMAGLPALGQQHRPEIDNGMESHRTIGHGEMEVVVAESAQLEIVAALQTMGSLQDKQGEFSNVKLDYVFVIYRTFNNRPNYAFKLQINNNSL